MGVSGKTYSGRMSTCAFLERVLDHTEQGSEEGAEIAEAMGKACILISCLWNYGKMSQNLFKRHEAS